MRNPFKRTENDKRAAALQAELKAACAKLADLDAGKVAAQVDSVAFAKWSAERNAAALEVDRLTGLIETNETEAETARKAEADAATRREIAAARKAANDLAARIRTDGQRIAAELLQLAKDAAQQALDAKRLNETLPDGEAPIPAADIIARDFGAEPRKDIASRTVDLWVAETSGDIIGGQDAVASDDGINGQVHVFGGSMRWKCVKRRFRETEFHPATSFDWPGSFYELLRLPRFDAQGCLFDGSLMVPEAVADLDVAAAVAPRKKTPRSTQIELVPVDPAWPPADAKSEADRNSALR
ncbi:MULTISPECIES: hypothetical protein [unclassified Bradyrhizobium]|uniref:hypothetical protein n=1 Tax=unclassified Bradyrhizobium TaxID=2631580 RepID=UPI001FF76E72|nr:MULTISPECIES: hypothetical protein [unclassified Bradyrhizobium]MCK1424598.1 hypothetical protein [Bradyrhizobium sp. CW12]MCK1646461.1 hypothetical protein [Bradyrhizobium sp. 154]MCK1758756.1 hypothetical protein [Bradyrhizobium sp. 137]